MLDAKSKSSPQQREFIQYNEKGEPIVLRSNVGHSSLHPDHANGDGLSPLTSEPGFADSDPWAPEVVSGSMRFFAGANRFTQSLGKK